ncbi:MAG: hypothetical protein WDO14_05870 [Bacteroidota bacterium]
MQTFFIIVGAVVVSIVIFVVYRLISVRNGRRKQYEAQMKQLQPLLDALKKPGVSENDIRPFVNNFRTRSITHETLLNENKLNLFPAEYLTIEKSAEGDLANWLSFPTEFDSYPDEMEHLEKVMVKGDQPGSYFHVFKFRTNEPHWAAKYGWMVGISGPYDESSQPYEHAYGNFSNLTKLSDTTPGKEVGEIAGLLSKMDR